MSAEREWPKCCARALNHSMTSIRPASLSPARPARRLGIASCWVLWGDVECDWMSKGFGSSLHRQLQNAPVAVVGHVDGVVGVDGHTLWEVEVSERQCRGGGFSGRELQHPVVDAVGDIEVARRVHRDTGGILRAGEWQCGAGGFAGRQLHYPVVAVVDHVD